MTMKSGRDDLTFEGGYYVYGLIDPFELMRTQNELLSVFYVGKGKDLRWEQHQKDVRKTLESELLLLERIGSKAERIRKILERGGTVSAVRLSGGYENSDDAYRAESLAIDLVGDLLRAAGRPPLTNAQPGHHAGFIPLGEHFRFVTSEDMDIPPANGRGNVPRGDHALLVKGTAEQFVNAGHRLLTDVELPAALEPHRSRLKLLDDSAEAVDTADHEIVRPGWDSDNPWNDNQARDRARRYWKLGVDRAAGWLADPESAPAVVLLGIPDGAKTVVRYAWELQQSGTWEFFPASRLWGVPLGRRLHSHRALGRALYEDRDGRRVQVLANHVAGWRTLQL
ncbi:hypothetical protein Rrhod_2725 [Rhodococcus rhodnii LMG 5362]|uniref:GIY-YIG domain-containing protein n=1 Tax=Rhodococcus rhodnii LMG 5362 TaxID=1273125 RepID=R7WPD1_9NOCA|nr:GIY-YIG nuclease family protein [Rhodococcus rhodnii]EOM75819.1 hypothetical protein Rrhod_2725 [Rhodococcus rhodnii LMG 5362]